VIQHKIIIIAAPSGSGKTSITHFLLNKYPNLAFSISAATRQPRGFERDSVDYYFLTADDFQQKIENNEFVEWEMVYEGKYYGTLKSELQRIWDAGKVPILDIDVKGAIHVEQQYKKSTLSIFIEPPSIEELQNRLQGRGTETQESLAARINKAAYEISFKHHFNINIINNDLAVACKEADEAISKFLQ
jgi:guanylate kinase